MGRTGGGVFETMPEEEFLGELSEKTTSVTIKEFTPDGVLISYNLQGTQKGQYDATHMETVDALFKPDARTSSRLAGSIRPAMATCSSSRRTAPGDKSARRQLTPK